MANSYIRQDELVKLSTKTGQGFPTVRASDMRRQLYGGRGNSYDELVYLRGVNNSSATIDLKDSDAWNTFATGKGVVGSRADQERHDFYGEKTF